MWSTRWLLASAALGMSLGLGGVAASNVVTQSADARGDVTVTAAQLQINQRISQAAVRRSNEALGLLIPVRPATSTDKKPINPFAGVARGSGWPSSALSGGVQVTGGATGPQGPKGDTGPKGPVAVPGTYSMQIADPLPPGQASGAKVFCPVGQHVTGAGFWVHGMKITTSVPDNNRGYAHGGIVVEPAPGEPAEGWAIEVENDIAYERPYSVWVLCM